MRFIACISFIYAATAVALTVPEGVLPRQDPDTCETRSQCDTIYDGRYCNPTTHKCEPLVNTGQNCTVDVACRSGFCSSGFCNNDVIGKTCKDAYDCDDKGEGDYICSPTNKTCLAAQLPEGSACSFHDQCANGRCFDGVYKACSEADGPKCDFQCQSSLECPAQSPTSPTKYCNLSTHTCEWPNENGEKCTSDDACQSGICISGVCRENYVGESCKTAEDCPGASICSSTTKTCLASSLGRGSSCSFKEQCLSGYCSPAGVCEHKPGGEYSDCSTTADCIDALVCRRTEFIDTKTCQPNDGSIYSPCSEEMKCSSGLMCTNGECNKLSDSCTA